MPAYTITRRTVEMNRFQARIDWLRAEADELRESGDCDYWNLAAQYDREADDLETLRDQLA